MKTQVNKRCNCNVMKYKRDLKGKPCTETYRQMHIASYKNWTFILFLNVHVFKRAIKYCKRVAGEIQAVRVYEIKILSTQSWCLDKVKE